MEENNNTLGNDLISTNTLNNVIGNSLVNLDRYNFIETQLPINNFQIDKRYQREHISQRIINKIIRNFNWLSFGRILVNQRGNGDFYIMDGVHRYNVLLQKSIATAPCLLAQGLVIQEESSICRDMMSLRKKSTLAEGLKAALVSGDKDMLYIEAKLQSANLRLGLTQSGNEGQRKIGWITCFGILLRIYRADQKQFNLVIETLHKLWYLDEHWEPDALRQQVIGGLWFFLKQATRFNMFDIERLISQCGGIGKPKMYFLKGQSNRVYSGKGSLDTLVSRELLLDYNKGLRGHNKLSF